jgi:DNA (cytosine-5)-methyltransferase 1
MNELALFAGAGGGILGGHLLGWRTVCAVEYEPDAVAVLVKRQNDGVLPPFPVWDDVRTFDGKPWRGIVDVVSGGFPCQDISCANTSGKGIDGERSGLWKEMARIIREVRPRFAFMENSPMLTIRGLGSVLGDLAEMGYDARWGVLGASSACRFGLVRERIWIVAVRDKIDVKRLQVQSRINAEVQFRSYPISSNLSDVKDEWLLANGYICRTVDDVARTMDRIMRVGNGQIPAVVRNAWHVLCPEIGPKKLRYGDSKHST